MCCCGCLGGIVDTGTGEDAFRALCPPWAPSRRPQNRPVIHPKSRCCQAPRSRPARGRRETAAPAGRPRPPRRGEGGTSGCAQPSSLPESTAQDTGALRETRQGGGGGRRGRQGALPLSSLLPPALSCACPTSSPPQHPMSGCRSPGTGECRFALPGRPGVPEAWVGSPCTQRVAWTGAPLISTPKPRPTSWSLSPRTPWGLQPQHPHHHRPQHPQLP